MNGKAKGKNERGYIALARGVLDHKIVGARKPYTDFEAWVWLLFEAAYKPKRVRVSNEHAHGTVQLERGQLSHSLRYTAMAWGWLSDKRVRTFLYRLKTDAQIDAQTDHLQTVITIRNYELYQNPRALSGPQADAQTDAAWTQHGRKEERKKERKKRKVHAPSAREATEKEETEEVELVNEPPKAKLFRVGRTILLSLGVSEKQSGSIIGRWLKEKNDPQGILAALQYARDHVPVGSPIAYVTQLLAKDYSNGKISSSDRATQLADQARELERAAGIGRPPDAQ